MLTSKIHSFINMCKISFLCRKFTTLYQVFEIKMKSKIIIICVRKSFCTILKWIRWRPWLSPIEISLAILNEVYFLIAHLMKMSKEGSKDRNNFIVLSFRCLFLFYLCYLIFFLHVYVGYQSGNCFLIRECVSWAFIVTPANSHSLVKFTVTFIWRRKLSLNEYFYSEEINNFTYMWTRLTCF